MPRASCEHGRENVRKEGRTESMIRGGEGHRNGTREHTPMKTGQGIMLAALLASLAGCGGKKQLPHEGKSVAELERMLDADDPAVQAHGALGLSRPGTEASSAVPRLTELLASSDALVRQNAAVALGKAGEEARSAVPALVRCLSDSEWTVRRQAALALGAIGPAAREALPALQKLQRDSDKLVSRAAREAILKITPPAKR